MSIPAHIEQEIQRELDAIEAEHRVRVLFACESGSRAWGFASSDSDFDARFIYVRPRDWYLSIVAGRDVVERPVDEVFDVSGWDLRKALGLLRGGNATLAEWLDSPIVYREQPGFREQFVALIDAAHRPDRSYWHYRSVSERHQSLALGQDSVKLKKWLYALRTCLAAQWAGERGQQPPMRLADLADGMVAEPHIRGEIDRLIAVKAGLGEQEHHAVSAELVEWLRSRIDGLALVAVEPVEPRPVEFFDEFLRAWVD